MKYEQLVKALRCCGNVNTDCTVCPWDKYNFGMCAEKLYTDAAAAIEALQAEVKRLKAENPIVETVLVDKMRQQMEETVCHCNVKENAELIAKILDDDVDRKVFELPKRGEWEVKGANRVDCSVCGHSICFAFGLSEGSLTGYNYCPNCGAKMEVQE